MITKQPVLIMIQGPEPGSFYKLPDNRVTTIGRSSRNTLRALGPSVSRFHCEVCWVNGRWELNDLNSKKGTLVNGRRIEDKLVLHAGDIIRLSTIVFRFDMIEESALRDGAMMAIVEAGMDTKLAPKGAVTGSLEDIRARSRLEVLDGPTSRRPKVKTLNLAFLGVTAAAIGIGATAFILHTRARASRPPTRQAEQQAARTASEARREVTWATVQQMLSEVPELERQGNYAAALALYDEIEALHPAAPLLDLVKTCRQYTVRLAHVSFDTVKEAAEARLTAGDRPAALELYRRARERIGVPELVGEADAKIAELQSPDEG